MGNAFRFDLHAKSVLGRGPHQGRHGNVPIRYHRLWLLAGLVLLTVIYTARPATAEMYVGLYGTYGIQIGKPNPTIRAGAEIEDVVGLGLEVTLNDVDIDNFLTVAARIFAHLLWEIVSSRPCGVSLKGASFARMFIAAVAPKRS
jgi:hypothetical protein